MAETSTQDRQDLVAALKAEFDERLATIAADPVEWVEFIEQVALFGARYSLGNQILLMVQADQRGITPRYFLPYGDKDASTGWRKHKRQVRKGETAFKIWAPVKRRPTEEEAQQWETAGRTVRRDRDGRPAIQVVGFRLASAFELSQTDGEPFEPPTIERTRRLKASAGRTPELLVGDDPTGGYDDIVKLIKDEGYEFAVAAPGSADLGSANGRTVKAPGRQTVRVRDDVDGAQRIKTSLHDLLTAPTRLERGVSRPRCAFGAPVLVSIPRSRAAACSGRPRYWRRKAGCHVDEHDQRSRPSRDVTRLVVPAVGRVASAGGSVVLLDASGEPVGEVSEFFASMLASGASRGSIRSYALSLLRWWRFLGAVDVPWAAATRSEARDFVLWMRLAGPAVPRRGGPGGYAPATINHALAVVKTFYVDRISAGSGPLLNPVPGAAHRAGRRIEAHHNPMDEFSAGRRAPLRQRVPERVPRSLPDHLFDALFAALRSDRDRALLAFYVSTGARASELLGVAIDRVDPGEQRIGVHRKGSGRLQWLPASADAFVWLRLYEQHAKRPGGETALWLTRRQPVRPLTYPAARRMLQRANESLATGWTLHDLRHTAAQRMIDDPGLSLTDVQWVLGHAHLTTTQLYLRPRPEEVVVRVLEHHRARKQRPALAPPASGYSADVLETLLGGGIDV